MAKAADKPSGGAQPRQKQVKLFVTSYSDEFFAERDVIRREILPVLRTWCKEKRLLLVDSFHKWGGRHPDQRNVAELERLQTSIENCYFSSIMPIFINITSSALGWVPQWGEYPEEVVEDFQEAYGLLYEDLEILSGAFRDDNPNSLYLSRDDSFITTLSEEAKSTFVQRTSASHKTCGDDDKISLKFPSNRLIPYTAEYKGLDSKKRPLLTISEEFKKKIMDFTQNRIAYDFCGADCDLNNQPDQLTKGAHLGFLKAMGRFVYGRDNIMQQVENYIVRSERDVPLVLMGSSGAGKTSALCLAANTLIEKAHKGDLPTPGDKKENWRVFYHFVGAVPGSTSLEEMLKRLLRETGMTKKASNCAKDLDSAAQMCCSMLSNPNTEPLILFLDAADQFSKEHGARVVSWVPRKLAPQVRLVLATVTDSEVYKALQAREAKPLDVKVTPLELSARQAIVHSTMTSIGGHDLNNMQMRNLLLHQVSENPLWLTLACQELKLSNPGEDLDQRIQDLPASLLLLFEQVLQRLESSPEGDLLVATLCLLEASASGLNETELRQLLADDATIRPPDPFEEKEETEGREKDVHKERSVLSEDRWNLVSQTLQPYVRPYGDSQAGRLDFYHRSLSKAVKKRYMTVSSEPDNSSGKKEKSSSYFFWHRKLAEFFRDHKDSVRMVEEYPNHLACLDDKFHLSQCLCQWRVFDHLYHEEYSSTLMAYWRKVGPISEMISSYESALKKFEEADSANEAAVSLRYEKVCRVTIQAGKHQDALELLKTAMKIEEKELGARQHRMVELLALMSEIYDEKLKLNDFVSRSQLPDLRKTIHYAKKSINIRKTLPGPYHKFKLGVSLMRLAFNMKSWEASGAGSELSGPDAVTEGNKYIDRALKIFMELSDMGHYAEALMTKGVLAPRGTMEQLKLYNQAMELCMQMYGELHILTSRLYINIGIVYEDNKDYKKSYQYFKKWARLSEEIMGPDHPKTLRAKGVLRESRYRRIAIELGEWVDEDNLSQDVDSEEERQEACEMEHSYDDAISNLLIVSQEEAQLEAQLEASLGAGGDNTVNTVAGTTASPASPSYNIVPLLPNSYLESVMSATSGTSPGSSSVLDRTGSAGNSPSSAGPMGSPRWQRNSPRDTSSYLRSRLERSNAIRRGVQTSDHSNLITQLGELRMQDNPSAFSSTDSHTTMGSGQPDNNENRRFISWFDNLLSELTHSSGASQTTEETSPAEESHPRSVLEACLDEANRRQQALTDTRWEDSNLHSSNRSLVETPSNRTTDLEQSSAERILESLNRIMLSGDTDSPSNIGNGSDENLAQVFANGFVPSDNESGEDNDSNHEGHSDSENFYDDNFEDYDEHYIISGEGNVADNLTADEEEEEINRLGGFEELEIPNLGVSEGVIYYDNRIAEDLNSSEAEVLFEEEDILDVS